MKTANQVMQYIPKRKSKKMKRYVENEVLGYSRYLFIWKEKDKYYGHCTHCKKEYEVERLKHKSTVTCDKCESELKVQYDHYSRSKMIDEEYFVYYEKALRDKESIVARGFIVTRDYRRPFREVQTEYKHVASYLFRIGGSWLVYTNFYGGNFLSDSVTSLYSSEFSNYRKNISLDSIQEAIIDTQFQYFNFEQYVGITYYGRLLDDMTKFFSLSAKYPCTEYLTKLGMGEFVEAKLHGNRTYSSINWNGKSIDTVLKIPKQNVKEVLSKAKEMSPRALRMYQLMKEEDPSTTIEYVIELTKRIPHYNFHDNLMKARRITKRNIMRILRYVNEQASRNMNEGSEVNQEKDRMMNIYADYLDDCKALGKDLENSINLYPRNLLEAHRETIKQREYKEDKIMDDKIAKRAKILSEMEFSNGELIAMPFKNTKEIIVEGKVLKHCIGQYIERYAEGKTSLFAIREKHNPEMPFYTMEVRNGRVSQFYGYENNIKVEKSDEVIMFVEEFENKILKKKEEKVS